MSWKKRQYIEQAFGAMGLASYVYDLQPEQWRTALNTLDRMMALWDTKGMRVGYPLPSNPDDSQLSDLCECPDIANAAIVPNLAVLLCPEYGKTAALELSSAARDTRVTLAGYCAQPGEIAWGRNIPSGAGNGHSNIYLAQDNPIATGSDSNLGIE